MNKYVIMFEYNNKQFMDLNKILVFKKNLEKLEQKGNSIKFVFYGDASNEEFATFMGFFNKLVQKDICDVSISFRTKELVLENGINNRAIKASVTNARSIKSSKYENIIKEFYNDQSIQIKFYSIKSWESIILDLIGE